MKINSVANKAQRHKENNYLKSRCLRLLMAILYLLISVPFFAQEVSQSVNSNWQFSESGKNEWLPAKVPGTIHTDLLAQGKIPDPFMGTNESKVQWVETKTWEYKTIFDANPEIWKSKNKTLVFDGLDTYAEIFLNDEKVLTAEDMFSTYTIDVNKSLKEKGNTLRIIFHPASELISKNRNACTFKNLPGGDRVYIRKAQYQFGWDWGPRLVTCGIWKNVHLEGNDYFTISNFALQTDSIKRDTAFLTITGNATYSNGEDITMELFTNNRKIIVKKIPGKGRDNFLFIFKIPHPKLWWCNGMGKANLYDFKLIFRNANQTVTRFLKTGIRTIELDQSEKNNKGFTFILNGQPVFARGANWIPCDNFLPRVTSEKYYSLLKEAQQSNMNMLRVWGGGIYESEDFYADCDSLGIMVWQDFMFACGMYPDVLTESIKGELNDNIFRIQMHPSLTLLCGNNESEEGWNNWNWQKEYAISASDSAIMVYKSDLLFKINFPAFVKNNCVHIPYISTSPSAGWGHPEAYQTGDVHYWGVWWGNEPFSSFDNHVGRFMSEYGFQATPPLSSFALFDENGSISLDDPAVRAHQKHSTGFETINKYMERDYPVPAKFSDYVYVSQVMQRDGISRAIEDHRRAMPWCSGTLFWQYNDCWPATSWSSTDYFGQKKLLQYALKDLYAPVMISVAQRNDSILIYVVNDDTISHKGLLAFGWMDFTDKMVRTSFTPTEVYNGRSTMVLGFKQKEFFDSLAPESGVLKVVFNYENSQTIIANHFFANDKSLKLFKDPGMATDIIAVADKPGTFAVTLTTLHLAKSVYLSLNDPKAKFSDNGFDMIASETKEVLIQTSLSLQQLKDQLQIQTMNALMK